MQDPERKSRGVSPKRRELSQAYMRARDPAERRRIAAELRAIKAANAPTPRVKVIECRWDLSRRYVRARLAAGWTPRDCDWCGGLYPARDEKHVFCSRVCADCARSGGRSEEIRRAVTHGRD